MIIDNLWCEIQNLTSNFVCNFAFGTITIHNCEFEVARSNAESSSLLINLLLLLKPSQSAKPDPFRINNKFKIKTLSLVCH